MSCNSSVVNIDSSAGGSYCGGCGIVLEENTIVSEITFGETSGGAAMVQGSYVSADASESTHTLPSRPPRTSLPARLPVGWPSHPGRYQQLDRIRANSAGQRDFGLVSIWMREGYHAGREGGWVELELTARARPVQLAHTRRDPTVTEDHRSRKSRQ